MKKMRAHGENVTVVMVCSDYYVPYLSVALISIINNTDLKVKYDIYIIHRLISVQQQKILKNITDQYENITLTFCCPTSLLDDNQLFISNDNYSVEAYYRMLVPWILSEIEYAIVMDCDIIVCEDLFKMILNYDISDYLVGGVMDVVYQGFLNGVVPDTYEYAVNTLNLKKPFEYINTGVLYMNLQKWRDDFDEKTIIDMMHSKKYRIQEQDMINVLVEGKVFFLPINWNFYVCANHTVEVCLERALESGKAAYLDASKQPFIYHYASVPKVWEDVSVSNSELWWYYARKSPFFETIMLRQLKYFETKYVNRSNKKGKVLNIVRSLIRKTVNKWRPFQVLCKLKKLT